MPQKSTVEKVVVQKRSEPWVRVFHGAKTRCSCKTDRAYKWYGGKGVRCLFTVEEVKTLWFRDGADKMQRPSIDRIDSDGHYEFSNCRFIELRKNCGRPNKEKPRCKQGQVHEASAIEHKTQRIL
jgi:hypothetical protein